MSPVGGPPGRCARWALVESAWVVARSPGPLHAFAERIRAKRGANVAAVAIARKLVVLFWHMLTKNEEYAYGRPSLTAEKLRRLELTAGAPSVRGKRSGGRVYGSARSCRSWRLFQIRVRSSSSWRMVRTHRSAKAFACGAPGGVLITSAPIAAKTWSKVRVYWPAPPRVTYLIALS